MPPISSARWFRLLLGLCAALFAAALVGASAELMTERMWARAMGFGRAFDRRLVWRASMWSLALLVSTAALFGSLRRVERMSKAVFGHAARIRRRVQTPAVVAGAVSVAPLLGDRWREAMLAAAGWRERVNGPTVLGVDPGFYVFRLPLLQAVTTWMIALCALCLVATVVAAGMSGLVFRAGRGVGAATPAVLRLLMVPFIALCGVVALGIWWARFAFASRAHGNLVGLFGLQYSIVIPMLSVLAMAAVALAGAVIPTVRRGHIVDHSSFDLWDELLMARVGVALWLAAALIGGLLIPAAAQSSQPFPRASERDALIRHYAATITAYDLETVMSSSAANGSGEPRTTKNDAEISPLERKPGLNLVALIGANTSPEDLVRIDAASAVSASGVGAASATLARTRSSSPAINDAALGVPVSNLWARLVMAVRFGRPSLLRDDSIIDKTVLVHHRDPLDRVHSIAPFLRFSSQPYPVVLGADTYWVVDGFATSDTFPGAQRFSFGSASGPTSTLQGGHFNYVRNSVKAVIDARTGRVRLYRTDVTDPLARSWARAFPGVLRPPGALETDHPGIGAQLRYPVDLLALQAQVLGAYHSRKPADIVDVTTRWKPSDLGGPDPSATGNVLYATAGESVAARSAVQVLEPVKTQAAKRYVLVGRTTSGGQDRLIIDAVVGPRVPEVRALVDRSRAVLALRAAIQKTKRTPIFGSLVPVNSTRYGAIYAQSVSSEDQTKAVRHEGVVLVGADGVVVGRDAGQAWERYVDLAAVVPVTVPNASELVTLRAAVAETQRRLAESEAVIDSLRRRVSVLESSGLESSGLVTSEPLRTQPTTTQPTTTQPG